MSLPPLRAGSLICSHSARGATPTNTIFMLGRRHVPARRDAGRRVRRRSCRAGWRGRGSVAHSSAGHAVAVGPALDVLGVHVAVVALQRRVAGRVAVLQRG